MPCILVMIFSLSVEITLYHHLTSSPVSIAYVLCTVDLVLVYCCTAATYIQSCVNSFSEHLYHNRLFPVPPIFLSIYFSVLVPTALRDNSISKLRSRHRLSKHCSRNISSSDFPTLPLLRTYWYIRKHLAIDETCTTPLENYRMRPYPLPGFGLWGILIRMDR